MNMKREIPAHVGTPEIWFNHHDHTTEEMKKLLSKRKIDPFRSCRVTRDMPIDRIFYRRTLLIVPHLAGIWRTSWRDPEVREAMERSLALVGDQIGVTDIHIYSKGPKFAFTWKVNGTTYRTRVMPNTVQYDRKIETKKPIKA